MAGVAGLQVLHLRPVLKDEGREGPRELVLAEPHELESSQIGE